MIMEKQVFTKILQKNKGETQEFFHRNFATFTGQNSVPKGL